MPFTFLLKFLMNPRVIVIVLIAIAVGGVYWKFHSLQSDLEETAAALKKEKDNNVILQSNLDTVTQINQANEKVLKQQQQAAKTNVETIQKLANDLRTSSQGFTDVQGHVDAVKAAPVPLTPYLKEAIDGIQEQRDLVNPPKPEGTK
jgi:uncharacterized protein HemX